MDRLSEAPGRPLAECIGAEAKALLMVVENELRRRQNFTRIFPTAKTYARYAKYFEGYVCACAGGDV